VRCTLIFKYGLIFLLLGCGVKLKSTEIHNYASNKPLGCTWNKSTTFFRVFAPRATSVRLEIFENYQDKFGQYFEMKKDKDDVWEISKTGHFFGAYYGYRVTGPAGPNEMFDNTKLIADPYSRAVVTKNEYLHQGKTLILDTSQYDWEGDKWLEYNLEDLIIYECHMRDLTAHPSSGVSPNLSGSYKGLLQEGIRGGLEHIKSLGVNAVEFLPIQDFGNIEIPYNQPVGNVTNTWNPYERNHWGYMTSYFFAPESYYASGQSLQKGGYCGVDGKQVDEFKDVVKAFHKEGIAVVMDVVYNHVSQYDQNCFKLIDKEYYFHLNPDKTFCSVSGCGNDLKTDRPMVRRLIIDSIKYWMTEYHIDGFRFDLAALIDWETMDQIAIKARKINPHVILIAEGWGGGKYELAEFSRHGWATWNDQIRNGVKGQNPNNGQSFIFDKWFEKNNIERIKSYLTGTLVEDGGLYQHKSHSVNYLESHDDFTLGDFIRIGTGEVGPQKGPFDPEELAALSKKQLKLNKLAALTLFVCQGPVMIHQGQEWARSKVIAQTKAEENHKGFIDHNSYEKDNETNWLNFEHADKNEELVAYYKGLINLRKTHPAFRNTARQNIHFIDNENPFALGMIVDKTSSGDKKDFIVLINAHRKKSAAFKIPPGDWKVYADANKVFSSAKQQFQKTPVKISPSSGMILAR
jgi:pullulanase